MHVLVTVSEKLNTFLTLPYPRSRRRQISRIVCRLEDSEGQRRAPVSGLQVLLRGWALLTSGCTQVGAASSNSVLSLGILN